MRIRTLVLFLLPLSSAIAQQTVCRANIDGVINPASAEFLQNAIEEADSRKASCLVIEIDTPGGLMKSMNVIVKAILTSPVPVVVYVAPSGSHCASAGVFLMMAAHVSAMAPGTNIGAAHPVTIGESSPDSTGHVMMEKVTNDAVSYIRSLAEKNGRNADWAEEAVRQSVSITENEALAKKVINLVVVNFDSLLARLNGMTVETIVGKKTIHTDGALVVTIQRGWRFDLLDILTDPNVAYILMMLGIYGLFFELYNPGSVLPGVIGGICIILAFYSFHTLPINYAGLALIIFGVILFLLEIKVTSYGVLSIGGAIALLLGSMMLIDRTDEWLRLSWGVIVPVVVTTGLFFLFIVGIGAKAQTRKVSTGTEGMIGASGVVLTVMAGGLEGQARIHGEIWHVTSESPLTNGMVVSVDGVSALRLHVAPEKPTAIPKHS